MNSDNTGEATRPETLHADAVCAQCNTVNAEGTLLCKVCGNNLRDQRMIRLAADQAMDLEHTGRRRRNWLSAILFFLAIILIISTLMNQELIVEWLIETPGTAQQDASQLWFGQQDEIFQNMLDDLQSVGLNEESARSALEAGPATTATEGVYAIYAGDAYAGAAIVSRQGGDLYFAALLDDGHEIRGRAMPQGNYFAASPEAAGVRHRGRITEVRGVAMPHENGVVDCIGDYNNMQLSFVAYRLPAI